MNGHHVPTIVLIGGCSGSGKTTLAGKLSRRIDITHRLGTGFLRETVCAYVNMDLHSFMAGHTFQPQDGEDPIEKFLKQSEYMQRAIGACINRAVREGTSLVIEGPHIVPGLVADVRVRLQVLLGVSDYDTHWRMVMGPTHSNRRISKHEFGVNRQIQEWLVDRASEHNIPVLDNSVSDELVERIVEMLAPL